MCALFRFRRAVVGGRETAVAMAVVVAVAVVDVVVVVVVQHSVGW